MKPTSLRRVWPVILATLTNFATVGLALVASVIIARTLGPSGRGEFATLMAVFALTLVVTELGQSAGVTYFAARAPATVHTVISHGQRLMLGPAVIAVAVSLVVLAVAPASERDSLTAYVIVMTASVVNAAGAPYLYAMQALSLSTWNRLRLLQPVFYTSLVSVLALGGRVTIPLLALCLVGSTSAALACAWRALVKTGNPFNRTERDAGLRLKMRRYGLVTMASSVPQTASQQLDKVLLLPVMSLEEIGHYAVAMSVAALASPVAVAVASVWFPRIAAADPDVGRVLGRRVLLIGAGVMMPATLAVSLVGFYAIPLVFGPEFYRASEMLWLLAPAAFLRGSGLIAATVLRGIGEPGRAAQSQVVVVGVALPLLVPLAGELGVAGAAISLALGELAGLVLAASRIASPQRSAALPDGRAPSGEGPPIARAD